MSYYMESAAAVSGFGDAPQPPPVMQGQTAALNTGWTYRARFTVHAGLLSGLVTESSVRSKLGELGFTNISLYSGDSFPADWPQAERSGSDYYAEATYTGAPQSVDVDGMSGGKVSVESACVYIMPQPQPVAGIRPSLPNCSARSGTSCRCAANTGPPRTPSMPMAGRWESKRSST